MRISGRKAVFRKLINDCAAWAAPLESARFAYLKFPSNASRRCRQRRRPGLPDQPAGALKETGYEIRFILARTSDRICKRIRKGARASIGDFQPAIQVAR